MLFWANHYLQALALTVLIKALQARVGISLAHSGCKLRRTVFFLSKHVVKKGADLNFNKINNAWYLLRLIEA